MKCFEGSRRPIRGWLGGHTGKSGAIPAPLVEFSYPGAGRPGAVSAVLLAPFKGKRPPDIRLLAAGAHADGWIHSLELALPDGRRDFVAWSWHLELPIEIEGRVVTDAPFVWVRRDARGKVARRFLLRGGSVRGASPDEA
jgi:hypothetical protein